MTYVSREIELTIQLGTGAFGEGGFTTLKLAGLRMEASIDKRGAPSMNTASVRVYGAALSQMNQLSTMGWKVPPINDSGVLLPRNLITLAAGDASAPLATVFSGTVTDAYADFSGSPDVPFVIVANGGGIESLKPVPPTSFAGSVDASAVMEQIATLMGVQFQNNGVSVQLSNPYFPGTAWTQAETCAYAANIEWKLDNGILSIWPPGGSVGGSVPEITPQNGLRGYPTYNALGVGFSALFNPNIHFGGRVKLTSSLKPACGTWYVYGLTYNLASIVPDGPWFMDVLGARIPGVVAV